MNTYVRLIDPYLDYINNVSTKGTAVGLETVSFIYDYLNLHNFKNIADLGSGFSSYVLRLYKKEQESEGKDITVYSIDNSKEWLNKTARFLEQYGLSVDGLIYSKNLSILNGVNLDFIFYDFGSKEVRTGFMPFVLGFAHKGTKVILSDTHREEYLDIVKKSKLNLLDLRPTLDEKGRFCSLVYKNKSS